MPFGLFNKQETLNNKLWKACANFDHDQIKQLLTRGADVNARNQEGQTPIFLAAGSGIIHDNSGLAFADDIWVTPSDISGDLETCRILLDAEADLSIIDKNGQDALITACANNVMTVASYLLKHDNIDVTRADNKGLTALHYAAMHGKTNVVDTLLRLGADIDAASHSGNTPLHLAAREGSAMAVKQLLALGANPDALNKNGEKPFWAAIPDTNEINIALRDPNAPGRTADRESWALHTDDRNTIIRTLEQPALGRSLTDIFNFSTQTCLRTTDDYRRQLKTTDTYSFDALNDNELVLRAHDMLSNKGGARESIARQQLKEKSRKTSVNFTKKNP